MRQIDSWGAWKKSSWCAGVPRFYGACVGAKEISKEEM